MGIAPRTPEPSEPAKGGATVSESEAGPTGDFLCDCDCAKTCPLLRRGTAPRCSLADLAGHFGCDPSEALGRLHEWWSAAKEGGDDEIMGEAHAAFAGWTMTPHEIGIRPAYVDGYRAGLAAARADAERLRGAVRKIAEYTGSAESDEHPWKQLACYAKEVAWAALKATPGDIAGCGRAGRRGDPRRHLESEPGSR